MSHRLWVALLTTLSELGRRELFLALPHWRTCPSAASFVKKLIVLHNVSLVTSRVKLNCCTVFSLQVVSGCSPRLKPPKESPTMPSHRRGGFLSNCGQWKKMCLTGKLMLGFWEREPPPAAEIFSLCGQGSAGKGYAYKSLPLCFPLSWYGYVYLDIKPISSIYLQYMNLLHTAIKTWVLGKEQKQRFPRNNYRSTWGLQELHLCSASHSFSGATWQLNGSHLN